MGYNISGAAMRVIEAIVKAARKPCPEIVKSLHSDRFVYLANDGTQWAHEPYATVEQAQQAHEQREQANLKDFASKLLAMEPDRLQSQAEYWVYDPFVRPLGDEELAAYARGAAQSDDSEWNTQIQAAAKREQQRRADIAARSTGRRKARRGAK